MKPNKKAKCVFFFFYFLLQIEEPNLSGVTHLLVDEIHERGMNEDFLIIILRDLLPRRPDLRLILMSATINADLFSKYFNGAPIMHIPVVFFVNLNIFNHHGVTSACRYCFDSFKSLFKPCVLICQLFPGMNVAPIHQIVRSARCYYYWTG